MPAFTTIALQNLLQHRNSGNSSSTLKNPQSVTNKPHCLPHQEQDEEKSNARKPVNWRIDGFEVESGESGGDGVQIEDLDDDDFVDSGCDSLSVASSSDLSDSSKLGFENMSLVSNQIGEFYDAFEDFSPNGPISTVSSCRVNIKLELHSTRTNLLAEIEKRKAAEDDVAAMRTHLDRVCMFLDTYTSLAPAPSSNNSNPTTRFDFKAVKQLSEEVIVVRFVAEAMGIAEATAEAEVAAHLSITSKDKEISRLQDRLKYYETMIHEMSRNNFKSMEVTRKRLERRRGRMKWLWSCIGMSVVIGVSVIAYSYGPHNYRLENVVDTQPEAGYD